MVIPDLLNSLAKDYKCGYQVQVVFDIAQIDTERALLDSIGKVYFENNHKWAKSKNVEHMRITNFNVLISFVEPLFSINLLLTRKQIDFLLWQEMLSIIKSKEHLTIIGVSKIKELRAAQHHYRSFIHKNIVSQVLSIRPD